MCLCLVAIISSIPIASSAKNLDVFIDAKNQPPKKLDNDFIQAINEVESQAKSMSQEYKDMTTAVEDFNALKANIDEKRAVLALKETMSSDEYKTLTNDLMQTSIKANSDNSALHLYIFVSQSMGKNELQDIFRSFANDQRVTFVFRGTLPNETLTEAIKRIHDIVRVNIPECASIENANTIIKQDEIRKCQIEQDLARKWSIPANIVIDPVAFSDYEIKTVPQGVLFSNSYSKNSTCHAAIRNNEPMPICYLIRAKGISNVSFFYNTLKENKFGDLGSFGTTYEIAENDLRDVLQEKAKTIDWEKEKAKAVGNFWRKMSSRKLEPALYHKKRYLDPTVIAPIDLKDHFGKILIAKGSEINPFDFVPFTKTIIVFNPERQIEIERVKNFINTHNLQKDANLMLVATHIPTSETENGWELYSKLVHETFNGTPIFLLNNEIRQGFLVRVTPTVIIAHNVKKLILLEELGELESSNNEILIEHRSNDPEITENLKKLINSGAK